MHDSERFDRLISKEVEKIPRLLQKIIDKQELSVYALNKKAYLSDRTLGGILTKKTTPQIRVLAKVLHVLGWKLSDFFAELEK
jgi:lambda repressor-like predicted transcriptional regulator